MTAPNTHPSALLVLPENIPVSLKLIDRWVVWRYELRDGKWTKPPFSASSGRRASSTGAATWSDFETALSAYREGEWDGIGLVLSDDDNVGGVDIDHRVVDGVIDADVLGDLDALDTYTEFSPSGDGLRSIFRANLPVGRRKQGNFEIYEKGRFLTITGHRVEDYPHTVEPRQSQVEEFHARRIGVNPEVRGGPRVESAKGPVQKTNRSPSTASPDDAEVLRRAFRAKNGAKFDAIYRGDDSYHDGDTSAGDLALCSMLAFYTQDEEQIDRLFRASPRMRDKWDEVHYSSGETYGERTVQVGLEGLTEIHAAAKSGAASDAPHVVPPPGAWPEVAEAFRGQRTRPLVRHLGVVYEWTGWFWKEVEDATIRAEFWTWLADAKYERGNDLLAWSPSRSKITDAVDALHGLAHLSGVQPPDWISGVHSEDPADLVPMRNGLLHVPKRRLLPATPEFFNLSAAPYDYRPDAPEPVIWLTFLEDVFEHDLEGIDALQEMFGYLLLPVTWLHKIFGLFGPARSGKGIILRTLGRMVGPANVAAPTFTQLGHQFGQQSLIGKSVATITDARVTNRTSMGDLVETLLTISGEDTVSVPRKYKEDWVGRLGVRFVVASNDVPFFPDSSTAVANRFVPLTTRKSYLGNEDHMLEDRIANETSGILNWALDGYDRLAKRGWFEGTASGDEILDAMETSSSPITEFVEEQCEIGPRFHVKKSELFRHWQWWAEDRGIPAGSTGTLTMYLNSAFPGQFSTTRPRGKGGVREWRYKGLRLRLDE